MEKLQDQISAFAGHAEKYIKTREELTRLVAAEKVSLAAGELFSALVLLLIFSTVFLFLSFSAAYLIAELSGKLYIGFAIVTGVYLLAGIVLLVTRKRWLSKRVTNSMIRIFLKGDAHE